MRSFKSFLLILPLAFFMSCQGPYKKSPKTPVMIQVPPVQTEQSKEEAKPKGPQSAKDIVDLTDKGIGPVKNVTLGKEIDPKLVALGKEKFNTICIACHRTDKRFVGPAPKGILKRRSPEWVMNWIMNPTENEEKNPIGQQLLKIYGTPMPDFGITKKEARALLEYFRTL